MDNKIRHLKSSDKIVTPFVNTINDNINIYVDKVSNKEFLLSDDGETLNDLSLNGVDLSDACIGKIERALLGSGVYLKANELVVYGDNSQFAEKKHALLQAILRVNNLMMAQRNKNQNH
ncbi:DUF1828 domain-containing protein [Leuconostoc pseudomesenteroides]|uniref:DUF1828 domain-containing protein n=1 Tax=Leuconostoc pseudomesenteroides TaxID=33968 RepID=UPI001662C2ED|nr:DUF1828 domain-containing protein [Leuconostoc pseudomesenteroides]